MKKKDGAAWWRESLFLARLRRRVLPGLGGAALFGAGCAPMAEVRPAAPDRSVQAIGLQREGGWDVGSEDQSLAYADASDVDVDGGNAWRDQLDGLFLRLLPARAELAPYYVPTLFQSLIGPGSERLREELTPIHSAAMDADFARGRALLELFEQAGYPADTAIVVDAPGPRAVAVAAALADRFDPVFVFGNWPHPLGVVPAHETLAAALYYLPLFERARGARPPGAPPLFVLDSNRLAPYVDDGARFDNRYLARVPTAAQLAELGVRHVLYVNPEGAAELDDLNEPFVELAEAGVDVRAAALADFMPGAPLDDEAAYWYGGSPGWHATFWNHYGWYRPAPGVWLGPCGRRRFVTVVPPAGTAPVELSDAPRKIPRARVTILGAGHSSPGRVSGGRSGSFGRAGGGHAG